MSKVNSITNATLSPQQALYLRGLFADLSSTFLDTRTKAIQHTIAKFSDLSRHANDVGCKARIALEMKKPVDKVQAKAKELQKYLETPTEQAVDIALRAAETSS